MDQTGFMTSNFAPSDTQRRAMSTMLSQQLDLAETAAQATERAKEELERVTRHLEELRTIQKFAAHSFAVLSKSSNDLRTAIARQKMILHPLRQLPDELLAQNFCTFSKSLQHDYLDETSWHAFIAMPGPGGDLSKMANCGQKQEAALDRYSSVSSSAIEWCHFRPVSEALECAAGSDSTVGSVA
jgi:hypothetical protein